MSEEKSKVLIVDDVHVNLMILDEMLTEKEIEVYKAENGKQALEITFDIIPDLILLDVIMPVQDGFEVCKILKNDERTKNIPIIFLTAMNSTEDIVKGFQVGAVDYITKPFRSEEFMARVTTHLELKKAQDTIKEQNKLLKEIISKQRRIKKDLAENEKKFSGLITGLSDAVFKVSYPDGEYEYISPAVNKVFGFSKNNFYKTPHFVKKILHPDFIEYYEENIETSWGVSPTLKYKIIDHEGNERWIVQANKGSFDKEGNLIAIEGIYRNITTGEELEKQKDKLKKSTKKFSSSVKYAQYIQKAVLPSCDFLKQFIPENFILFMPRDIVSGDFYWIKQVNNYIAIAAADCTGHGVQGAFMSMLGVSLFHEIIRLDKYPTASEILDELRDKLKLSLHHDNVRKKNADGIDVSLCILDIEKKEVQYAGANSPLYIVRKNQKTSEYELIEKRPDRMPVGVYVREKPFKNNKIKLQTGDTLYLFSDGYINQFGGEKIEKFKAQRFKELLLETSDFPLAKQKEILEERFSDWKGELRQLDDVLVIGVKILDDYGNIQFFDESESKSD